MTRCKCCNRQLTNFELRLKKIDGEDEDMCGICRQHSEDEDDLAVSDLFLRDLWEFDE